MHYEQLIGVSFGLQVTNTLYEMGLNVAGLEAVSHQGPPQYRTVTGFHINRMKTHMSALSQEVHRMLRQTTAVRAQNVTLRKQLLQHHAVIQTAGGTGNNYRVLYYGDERSLI